MRALKALVIGMAVLIFVGVILLIVGIVDKAGELDGKTSVSESKFGATAISLPAGAAIEETRLDEQRILLRLALSDGTGRLIVISTATGEQIGTIDLKSSP